MISTRWPLTRIAAMSLVLAAAASGIGPAPVRADSSVGIEARALVAGRYEAGGWVAVAVTLVNEGPATDGHLVAATAGGSVRRGVEMPAGARKVVSLYVRPGGFQRAIEVAYEEPNGRVTTTVDVRVLEIAGSQLAIVGDPAGTLRPQLGSMTFTTPEPIQLAVGDLPERPEPLDGLSTIVWAADATGLTAAQRSSLERWVASGGQLVVVGGADWQARAAAFEALLPVTALRTVDGVPLEPMAAWAGAEAPPAATATVATGTLVEGARAAIVADGGDPLLSWRTLGTGRVVLVGPDVAVDDFRAWDGSPQLWSRLAAGPSIMTEAFGAFPDAGQSASAMATGLDALPVLEVPPVELLLLVIVAYIALIGPVSYLVLRRIDRRELAWVTAPVLVVLFTACSYGIGATLKGSEVILNQISVIHSGSGGGVATVETYAGLFSPTRGTFDLVAGADALIGSVDGVDARGGGAVLGGTLADQGEPARLRSLPIGAGAAEHVRASAVVDHVAPLEVALVATDGGLTGSVTNAGSEPIADVALISSFGGLMIGDLAPGQRLPISLSGDGFRQTSAADQVYGFGGFDSADPDRRRIAARRAVIDALVGYGGWMAPTAPFADIGRGPYVIGWRSDEGPMPITVEGVETQRFAETVEVVSIRPSVGDGTVAIGAGELGVTLETEGEAGLIGTGTASIGDGSATFRLALPLDATGLRIDELEILAGADAATVIQGGVGGAMWPPGLHIELLDVASGTWTMLGDLSEGTTFTVDEPGAVVDGAGRLTVRVSGRGRIDPGTSQPPVFVSAAVRGTMEATDR